MNASRVVGGLRWLTVMASPLIGWCAAVLLAILLIRLGEAACPPQDLVSGMCMASWFPMFEKVSLSISAAAAAAIAVFIAAASAPAWKAQAAWLCFGFGSVLAAYVAVRAGLWLEWGCAVLSGLVAALCVARRINRDRAPL